MARRVIARTIEPLRSGDWKAVEQQAESPELGSPDAAVRLQPIPHEFPASLRDKDWPVATPRHMVVDFECLVEQYGIDCLMAGLSDETFWRLWTWFKNSQKQRHL